MTAVEVDLDGTADALQAARCALKRLCADQIHGDLLLDAELLISELATDAFMDGGQRIVLNARLAADRLFVEVIGQDPRFESDNDGATGGGLDTVDDLSSRWGVHEGTSHVWFELQR